MSKEITLAVGCSAEADTCGSCKFFMRRDDSVYGQCRITLPKKFVERWDIRRLDEKITKKDVEYTGNEDQIKDTDRCDLHRHSGIVYIVQRRVGGA